MRTKPSLKVYCSSLLCLAHSKYALNELSFLFLKTANFNPNQKLQIWEEKIYSPFPTNTSQIVLVYDRLRGMCTGLWHAER